MHNAQEQLSACFLVIQPRLNEYFLASALLGYFRVKKSVPWRTYGLLAKFIRDEFHFWNEVCQMKLSSTRKFCLGRPFESYILALSVGRGLTGSMAQPALRPKHSSASGDGGCRSLYRSNEARN